MREHFVSLRIHEMLFISLLPRNVTITRFELLDCQKEMHTFNLITFVMIIVFFLKSMHLIFDQCMKENAS
jgi:hypothetical protein